MPPPRILCIGLLIISGLGGCFRQKPANLQEEAEPTVASGPLRILVLDDPELAAAIDREWRARSDDPVELTTDTTANFYEQLHSGLEKLDTDVVLFAPALLGELCERRLIRQLPKQRMEAPGYAQLDIFSLIRRREMLWDERPFAVPLGSPPFSLLVRNDLVSSPPATWAGLANRVAELRKTLPPGIVPLRQPLAEGWASQLLLSRAATYVHDPSRVSTVFDYRTMRPRIDNAAFTRALDELVGDYLPDMSLATPADALRDFLEGRAAMAITWPAALPDTASNLELNFPVTIHELPGARERYDLSKQQWEANDDGEVRHVTVSGVSGRLGAISRAARHHDEATRFLGWVTGPDQSALICPRSSATCLFRESHLPNPSVWVHPAFSQETAQGYANAVSDALECPAAMPWIRLPQQHRYAKAWDSAIQQTLQGSISSGTALSDTTARWQQITAAAGLELQRRAYRRSLGVDTR